MKKALSMILALTLCMALAVPALAAETKTYTEEYCEVTNVTKVELDDNIAGNYPVILYAVAPVTLTITKSVFDYEESEYYEFVKYCTIEYFGDDGGYLSDSSIEDFEGEKDIRREEDGTMAAGSYCVFQPGKYGITIGGGMERKDKAEAASSNSSGWHVGGSSSAGWGNGILLYVTEDDGQAAPEQTPAPEQSAPAAKPVVIATNQNLTVDGEAKETEIYNIDGSNYFKLRDMAALLNGTDAQFSVDFDAERNTIVVKTGEAYTEIGGELETGTDKSASAVASAQSIEIDGEAVALTAFNIGGNNFFKLRELGTALGFGVDYDEATATMLVTSK